jgi:hypothetical protein
VRVANALVTGKGANGFFVQVKEGDPGYTTADFSGLFVFTGASSPFLTGTQVGNRVSIDASVALFNGQLELDAIVAVTVTNAAVEAPPAPIAVTTAEIATSGPRAAALESVLIRIGSAVSVTTVDAAFNEFTVMQAGGGSVVIDDFLFLTAPLPTVGTQYGVGDRHPRVPQHGEQGRDPLGRRPRPGDARRRRPDPGHHLHHGEHHRGADLPDHADGVAQPGGAGRHRGGDHLVEQRRRC